MMERQAGEGVGAGYEDLETFYTTGTAEVGYALRTSCVCSKFKRHPNDLDSTRMDIETSRYYFVYERATIQLYMGFWITYHAMTFTVSGTVSGSNGGTVTLNLCRASDGEKLATTSRTGNGAYSFTWYDSAQNLYVEAYEDGTHIGRSDNGTAT